MICMRNSVRHIAKIAIWSFLILSIVLFSLSTVFTSQVHAISVTHDPGLVGGCSEATLCYSKAQAADGPLQLAMGEVLINEFVAANGTLQTSEWVELYNTTAETVDIGSMWIDDINAGGGAPKQIPAGTTIAPHGFYVMTFSSFLNNTGDDVRLLGTDKTTVYDAYTYTFATTDMSWCRKPDGVGWSPIECTPTQGTTNNPPLPPGTWIPGTLEIHVLNVGQGESQLIVGPTGKTLLIDVFEASWNTNNSATWVASEIRRITGSNHLDYVMATHWHLDHMGYAGHGGIWSLLEQQGITADVLIDRDGGVWVDGNSDGICDPDTEIVWHNAGSTEESGTARNWVCWAGNPNTIGGQIRQLAQIDSTTQIDLGLAEGVNTKIVQVDAQGVMQADGVTPVAGNHTLDPLPPSENDYSITVWLNWGKFDYVTGGDTDGEYDTSEYGYSYNDEETNVAARIGQEVEVIWVNHHGSAHSTNATYVSTLNPDLAIISPGSTNTYGHPDQIVLDRLYTNGTMRYLTQMGDPARDYYDSVIVNGNVVVQVTDGINYMVNNDPYVASDPADVLTEPPADFDGDGDSDLSVFKVEPWAGMWYLQNIGAHAYGNSASIPVSCDYNGDGTTDVAVYNAGTWYVKDQFVDNWGDGSSVPVPGDYDGDGSCELAVFKVEPWAGMWYIKDIGAYAYGNSESIPVPADYNNDGITDIAVYNAGTWYVKDLFVDNWGDAQSFPLPARDTNGDGDPYQ